jgi:hypothetical protein
VLRVVGLEDSVTPTFHLSIVGGMESDARKDNPHRSTIGSVAFLVCRVMSNRGTCKFAFTILMKNIEGDQLMFSLQDAMNYAQVEYGILESDWRPLRPDEVDSIPTFTAGKRAHQPTAKAVPKATRSNASHAAEVTGYGLQPANTGRSSPRHDEPIRSVCTLTGGWSRVGEEPTSRCR